MDWNLGWAAHEAIAAGTCLFAHFSRDPKQAILVAANSPGDSDSIATLAGALTGAYNGLDKLPHQWIEKVERGDVLLQYSEQIPF